MEPLKRSATKMLNTLTGKIPEKISESTDDRVETFDPLPSLEELDSSQASSSGAATTELFSSSDSSFISTIKNNLIAIVAGVALIAFTLFNAYAYYTTKGDKKESSETAPAQPASVQDTIMKSLKDAYATAYDKTATYLNGVAKTSDVEEEPTQAVPVPPPVKKAAAKNQVPGITSSKRAATNQEQDVMSEDEEDVEVDTLDAALKNASGQTGGSYKANDTYSSVKAKAGWCYIGEEKGYRSCAEVGENDICMSGDIFPTSQVCINPNLRA
jgi:hypothetical protein